MQAEESINTEEKKEKSKIIKSSCNGARKLWLNRMIVTKIFRSLNTESIRSVRLVCPGWADIATALLGKQGRLTFSTEAQPATPGAPKFDREKLLKEINLYMDCACSPTDTCHCSVTGLQANHRLASKFGTLWPSTSHHEKLTTLFFNIRKTFNPCLHEILRTYHFPKLTKVTIIADKVILDKADADNDLAPEICDLAEFKFQTLQNLKSLKFCVVSSYEVHFSGNYLSSLCQGLLNAAPNLDSFDLKANFYPDLTPCRRLEEVEFTYVEFQDFCTKDVVPLDASDITRMLESCRNSVEKLKLNYYPCSKTVMPEPIKLDFRLPYLTHLTIEAAHVYKIEDSLNTTNLLNLIELSLGFNDGDISTVMKTYKNRQHAGIASLHVGCTYYADGQPAPKLDRIFPAVKEFKLKLRVRLVDNVSEQDFRTLKETMQAMGGWNLRSGEVDVHFVGGQVTTGEDLYEVFVSKVMIAMMQGMKLWRGLRETSLRFFSYRSGTEFKLSDGTRDAFLACKRIGKVDIEGFQMTLENDKSFDAFIGENNLKIRSNNRKWV